MTEEDTNTADLTSSDGTGLGRAGEYPGTPRWVWVFGIIGILVVLLIVTILLTGGPGGHTPPIQHGR